MNQLKKNKLIRTQCDLLLRQGVLNDQQYDAIIDIYPVTSWDWRSLGRWFLFFGAISAVAGASILLYQHFEFTLARLALLLAVVLFALAGGSAVARRRGMNLTAHALELVAAFDLIGLTFTVGMLYSDGSGNWPMLLLIDLCVILPLSYLLHNVWLLVLSAVLFFTWFGGVTGYVSGWGMYYFGMNYPLRFLAVSVAIIASALLHLRSEEGMLSRYRGFFKVWLSTGLFFGEMSLWLLSLFGNFGEINRRRYDSTVSEIFLFNSMWTIANVLLVYVGSRDALRMMVGYGATFLIVQGYTVYFRYVAFELPWIISFGFAGFVALMLARELEKLLSGRRKTKQSTAQRNDQCAPER
jgi:membrane protein implicated in regulation of membrane protease activity